MIKKKTVFVLGAGASAPYGFPLGSELYDKVWNGLIQHPLALRNQFAASVMEVGGFDQKNVDTFAQHLREAGRYSIDEFLVGHRQYKEIGKMAIARLLMPYEDDAALDFDRPGPLGLEVDRRWYQYCFNWLLESATAQRSSLASNNLSVITFNFDRSFERSLFRFVQANCLSLDSGDHRSALEMARLMGEIPVYHIHGRLGAPDWFDDSEWATPDDHRLYEKDVGPERLKQCAEAIRLFDDEIEMKLTLENARGALAEAETVCFLGFSYHPMNLAKLHLHQTLRHTRIFGTAFEMDSGPRRRVLKAFEGITDADFALSPKEHDILTFLKESDVLYE